MVMNASFASFYIMIGTFDTLVTFIGMIDDSYQVDRHVQRLKLN